MVQLAKRIRAAGAAAGISAAIILSSLAGVLYWWSSQASAASNDDWPTSLHGFSRDAASSDTNISSTNAPQLKPAWTAQTGGVIAATATVAGGVAYFGSWDGNEYAVDATTGTQLWKTYLGVTNYNPICIPPSAGISSPPTIQNGVLYVGGGDSYWYALDAGSGSVLWKVKTGDSSAAGGNYNWSGPLIYNGFAYIGVASLGDCPLVQGKLMKVDLSSHQVVNTLNIVPSGQIGGGIWTSPALDPATNTIYTATGTKNLPTQHDAQAFLAIDANTMAIKDRWELPNSEAVLDSDFSTSTTLYTSPGGKKMVAAINKNGKAYAFLQSNLSAGPVWGQTIAEGGDCPTCNESSVSSGAYGGGRLYLAGENGQIGNQGYPGTVNALDPDTGKFLWQHPTSGPVVGALAYANGLVFVSAGKVFEVLDASNGHTLYSYDTGSGLYAGPSLASGYVYIGTLDGRELAFKVGSAPVTPPADPNCPSGWTCQDVGNVGATGSETFTSTSGGTWNIKASGGGLSGTTDSLRLMTKPMPSDDNVQVVGRVTALQNGNANAQTGLILRQSSNPSAAFYSVMIKPGNNLVIQQRTVSGGNAKNVLTSTSLGSLPKYLMILKQANTISAATSTDGATYTLIPGSSVTMVLPVSGLAGIAQASGGNGAATTGTLTNASVGTPSITPGSAGDGSLCPSGWTCQDVGNPSLAGGQTALADNWTIRAGGGDIWGNSDQFHYISKPLAADGTVSGRVTAVPNTDPNAKTGVMLRGGNDPGAAYYYAFLTPDKTIHVQYRDTAGWDAGEITKQTGNLPQYLEVARSGTSFTAYTSNDGTSWTAVPGSTVTIPSLNGGILGGAAVTSHNSTTLGTATMTGVTIGNSAPAPPNLCPDGWTCQDIGFPTPAGGQEFANGTWTVSSGGGDIWGNYDTYRMISQPLTGDASVSATITAQSNTGDWAKAGPMLRASSDPQAPYYAAFVTPAHGVVVQYRSAQAGQTSQISATGAVPLYLKVARSGTSFTAYTSTDGTSWTAVPGSTVTIAGLGGTALGGLAADAYNTVDANTTVWKNVTLTGSTGSAGLPSPWQATNVGNATPTGSASYGDGTFTVKGGGTDIWGDADQSEYVHQNVTGDGTFIARVPAQSNTDPWAKSGIMFKASTTSGSAYAAVFATPDNGVHLQANYTSDQTSSLSGAYPVWLKIVRSGNLFIAYQSPDDGTNWTKIGQVTVAMPTNATVGLFVNAHNGGTALNTSTFDNVNFTPSGGGALPAPWLSTDVGNTGLPGSSSFADNTFTLKGAGNDIWGSDDEFHLAYQPLHGDGTIIAQMQSLDNTDPWAKGGVMIKASTTSGSNYAMLAATPGNGLHMQYNFANDTGGGDYAFPNAWMKLTRSGNTITTYSSSDGQTWKQVGTATIDLPTDALIGLFVNAHDGSSALATATFTNVSVTSP